MVAMFRPKTRDERPAKRTCLKCTKLFQSQGPGNRICDKCRQVNATMAGAPVVGGAKRLNGLVIGGIVLLLCLVLPSVAVAEVKAVINGPTSGLTGDLVVLSSADSIGEGLLWLPPAGVNTLTCGDGAQIAFASGKAGVYTFTLIIADKEAAIAVDQHTVTITPQAPVPDLPPDNPDPDKPPDVPTPTPVLDALRDLSAERSGRLNDAVTAKALAAAIRSADAELERMCSSGQCPGLPAAKQAMVATIERTLMLRSGASRSVNWLDGWRVPINERLSQINPADVPTYRAAMRAVAAGLDK